jgi:hypothetical protein
MVVAEKNRLDPNKDFEKLMTSFDNREISEFDIYIEGFGGISAKRVKDGMVMFYTDKNRRFGPEDHVTFLFGKDGSYGIHRRVSDAQTNVYMKYDIDYLRSPEGITKLVQDMQKRTDMPAIVKPMFVALYTYIRSVVKTDFKSSKILADSEAQRLGMHSPCIYVKPRFAERLVLPIIGKNILMVNFFHQSRFKENPTEGFRETRVLGTTITKKVKGKKKKLTQ